jgi:hypothetical protein
VKKAVQPPALRVHRCPQIVRIFTVLMATLSGTGGPLFKPLGSAILQSEENSRLMIAAILFMVSAVALVQFALYYCRAIISGVAAQPISDRIRTAAGIAAQQISARDFRSILSLHDLSPDLRGPNGSFRGIRAYYSVVEKLGRLIPAMASWANAEMLTCSRYLAVLVDQHLERNLACAAQVRGI